MKQLLILIVTSSLVLGACSPCESDSKASDILGRGSDTQGLNEDDLKIIGLSTFEIGQLGVRAATAVYEKFQVRFSGTDFERRIKFNFADEITQGKLAYWFQSEWHATPCAIGTAKDGQICDGGKGTRIDSKLDYVFAINFAQVATTKTLPALLPVRYHWGKINANKDSALIGIANLRFQMYLATKESYRVKNDSRFLPFVCEWPAVALTSLSAELAKKPDCNRKD
jgi:hypothetical protein